MSAVIEGVPATITRADYTRLIEASGFTARDIVSLEFSPDGIHAVVFAKDSDGKRIIDGETLATHEVFVKVVDQ